MGEGGRKERRGREREKRSREREKRSREIKEVCLYEQEEQREVK
jgi:hypothetical protein